MEYSDKSSMTSAELQLWLYGQILAREKQLIEEQIKLAEGKNVKITEDIAILKKLIEKGDLAKAELNQQRNDKLDELNELREKNKSIEEQLRERKEVIQEDKGKLACIKENCEKNTKRLEQHSKNKEQTEKEAEKLKYENQQRNEIKAELEQFNREYEDDLMLTRLLREKKFHRKEAQNMVKELKKAVKVIWDKVREMQPNDRMKLP